MALAFGEAEFPVDSSRKARPTGSLESYRGQIIVGAGVQAAGSTTVPG